MSNEPIQVINKPVETDPAVSAPHESPKIDSSKTIWENVESLVKAESADAVKKDVVRDVVIPFVFSALNFLSQTVTQAMKAQGLKLNAQRFDEKPKKIEKKEKVVVVEKKLIVVKKNKKERCVKKMDSKKEVAEVKNDALAETAKAQPVAKAKPMPPVAEAVEKKEEKEIVAKASLVEINVNSVSPVFIDSRICISSACHLFSSDMPSEAVHEMAASLVEERQKKEELAVNSVAVFPFFAISAPILNASVVEVAVRNAIASANAAVVIKIADPAKIPAVASADPTHSAIKSDKISHHDAADRRMAKPKVGDGLSSADAIPLSTKESDHPPYAISNFVGAPGIPPKGVSAMTPQANGPLLRPEQRIVADTYPESSRDSKQRGEGEGKDRGEQQAEQEEENESAAT